ncbi:MAG: RNA methyltransferase [Ruminococcaceae bacterium]|nr:RNA methyltransferase [Oscillospiraceae bacterium]
MQKEENKFACSSVLEGMVSIRALLEAGRSGISDRKITRILYTAQHAKKNPREIAFLGHEAERQGFILTEADEETLLSMTVGNTHGGIIAVATERTVPVLTEDAPLDTGSFYVMIEGIEDPYNFGYALRSLYALGVSGILLPERNWLSAAGVVARASAGASELFSYFTSSAEDAVHIFKRRGFRIVCADVDTEQTLEDTPLPYPILLVVGGEKRGISRAVLNEADTVVRISYGRPFDAALSAASATTILAYEIAKQNRK